MAPQAHLTAEQMGAEATPSVLPRGRCDPEPTLEEGRGFWGERLTGAVEERGQRQTKPMMA